MTTEITAALARPYRVLKEEQAVIQGLASVMLAASDIANDNPIWALWAGMEQATKEAKAKKPTKVQWLAMSVNWYRLGENVIALLPLEHPMRKVFIDGMAKMHELGRISDIKKAELKQ